MDNCLKQLNFNDLLILDTDIEKYDFNVYMNNGKQHFIKGFCTKCEEKGCNLCPTDNNFKLQTISHAATTQDFLLATNQQNTDLSDWKNDSVLFLMEGPSVAWWFYEEKEFNGVKKKPTKEWYWVHDRQEKYSYPQEFKGGIYGTLFNSIIFTFKLKNAYFTNLVKCGLNNDDNKYKGINDYDEETLRTCVENFLLKEMEILKPKIVFCFGSRVENKLRNLYPDDYPFLVCGLPHPAGKRGGFKDEYYRHLYFTRILEGLYKAGIVSLNEAEKKFSEFLTLTNKSGV
jgi:hypothetical protein